MNFYITVFFFLAFSTYIHAVDINYGFDDVTNVSVISEKQENATMATAALFRRSEFYSAPIKFGDAYNFCAANRFANQPMLSYCSGTLISRNTILTAGHCIRSYSDCTDIEVTFDYINDVNLIENFTSLNKTYKCKKLLSWSKPSPGKNLIDYAIIELDRNVTDRKPIPINTKLKLNKPARIFSLGHPKGLPLKIFQGFLSPKDQKVNTTQVRNPFWRAHMNSFEGLSGGGVYDERFNLTGVLVRGESNIYKEDRCLQILSCTTELCPWIEIQKLNFMQKKLK